MSSEVRKLNVTPEILPPVLVTLDVDSNALSLIAATKLALAVVLQLDRTPNVILILEKLLSTSELVRGVPLTVAPV